MDKQVSSLMTLEARDGSVRWKVNPEHNSCNRFDECYPRNGTRLSTSQSLCLANYFLPIRQWQVIVDTSPLYWTYY